MKLDTGERHVRIFSFLTQEIPLETNQQQPLLFFSLDSKKILFDIPYAISVRLKLLVKKISFHNTKYLL